MLSVKINFRASNEPDEEGRLFYQITHRRAIRRIDTGYKIMASEWEWHQAGMVLPCSELDAKRAEQLQDIFKHVQAGLMRLNKIIAVLEEQGLGYTADGIVCAFRKRCGELSFQRFMWLQVDRLHQLGKIRTSETYHSALRSFMCYMDGCDIMMDEIDSALMVGYESWLKGRGVSMNTISFYMRVLQAIYNRALELKIIEPRNPFRHVYTGIERTVKRAVPLSVICQIKNLDLPYRSTLDWARDMFLFAFYTRGMSFIDMAYLRKDDLHNELLVYRRQKTGQQLFIKWESCMQEIIDKYMNPATPYLLPLIKKVGDERRQYVNALHLVNNKLKEISYMVGWPMPLTMYVARHSWASVAKSKNIPISVISEGMGHDSERTTRIYLASLDNSIIDNANKLIINDLFSDKSSEE